MQFFGENVEDMSLPFLLKYFENGPYMLSTHFGIYVDNIINNIQHNYIHVYCIKITLLKTITVMLKNHSSSCAKPSYTIIMIACHHKF